MGQVIRLARRMFDLVEPIGVIPYSADEPNEAMFALGFTNYWDTYFAGRAAPLGSSVPAERRPRALLQLRPGRGGPPHPEGLEHDHAGGGDRRPPGGLRQRAAPDPRRPRRHPRLHASRRAAHQGSDQRPARRPPHVRRAADASAAGGAGGPPLPRRLAAARAPRRRHISALMAEGIGGLEAHVLLALDMGIPAPTFGRIHHLPSAQLSDLIDDDEGSRARRGRGDVHPRRPAGQGPRRGADRRARRRAVRGPGDRPSSTS